MRTDPKPTTHRHTDRRARGTRRRSPPPAWTVSTLMRPFPIMASTGEAIASLAAQFRRHGIRHMPVVTRDGALLGMVSDHVVGAYGTFLGTPPDLWLSYEPAHARLTAADVVQPWKLVARPDEPLVPVLVSLVASPYDAVVVVDDAKHPVGLLTERDAVRMAGTALPPTVTTEHYGSSPVHTVPRRAALIHAANIMRQEGVRHVVVMDEGRVAGVLSHRDLGHPRWGTGPGPTVGDAMPAAPVHSAAAGTALSHIAQCMTRLGIGCVPVVDSYGRPSRIVTRTDIVTALARGLRSSSSTSLDGVLG